MSEQIRSGGDAGQRREIGTGSPGRIGDALEGLAPVQLPDQDVDQFFVSVSETAFWRWATTEPA